MVQYNPVTTARGLVPYHIKFTTSTWFEGCKSCCCWLKHRTNSLPSSRKLLSSALSASWGGAVKPKKFPVVVRINCLRGSAELGGIFLFGTAWTWKQRYITDTCQQTQGDLLMKTCSVTMTTNPHEHSYVTVLCGISILHALCIEQNGEVRGMWSPHNVTPQHTCR